MTTPIFVGCVLQVTQKKTLAEWDLKNFNQSPQNQNYALCHMQSCQMISKKIAMFVIKVTRFAPCIMD